MAKTCKIPLNKELFALVDTVDYIWLSQWTWGAELSIDGKTWYVRRREYLGSIDGVHKLRLVSMHRLILGLEYGDNRQGDHRNGNGLDNRRSNLRVCSATQNKWNRRQRSNHFASSFKGVGWKKKSSKWFSRISVNGHRYHLGYFDSELDAAQVYNDAALLHFGEFALLNNVGKRI